MISENPSIDEIELNEMLENILADFRENATLVPGKRINKDPRIILHAYSEDAYIFIGIENDLRTYLEPINYSKSWRHIKNIQSDIDTDKSLDIFLYDGEYSQESVIFKNDNDLELEPIFQYIDVKADAGLSLSQVENLDHHIVIIGFAHQAKIKGTYDYDIAEEAAIQFFKSQFSY